MPSINDAVVDKINHKSIKTKIYSSLLGVCQGLIADNELNEKEFLYLRQWMLENQEYLSEWPCDVITEFQQRRKSLSKSSVSAFKFPEMTVCKAL